MTVCQMRTPVSFYYGSSLQTPQKGTLGVGAAGEKRQKIRHRAAQFWGNIKEIFTSIPNRFAI